jgi:transposase-like protein
MNQKRRTHSSDFKSKVALEAIKERRTVSEIASDYQIHPNQVTLWKNQLVENLGTVFSDGRKSSQEKEDKEALLYQQIGQLQVELDWLKKKSKQLL